MDVCHLNSWSLHGESILFLWDVLIERRPRDILELGTGWSSLMFGKYAQHILQNHAVLVSVASAEHDSTWAVHTTEMLETHGLGRFVQIYTDPLQMLEIDGANGPGYDLSALGEQDFDFVLIDGPPGNLGRELTLPLILPRVRRRALIFLDDAQRPMEQAAISKWRLEYESRLAFRGFVPVGNGLGCFERI
jgi:predicted O-methyltransferase YrrM